MYQQNLGGAQLKPTAGKRSIVLKVLGLGSYRFQRKFNEKLKDRDDIYLEVKTSEERRKRKDFLRAS